jgi:hypothetical protein
MKRVSNKLTILIELIKYGSKIFTEPDIEKKTKVKGRERLYVAALNNIFDSMKGFRIFERFGFNLPKGKTINIGASIINQFDEWKFDSKYFDWLNTENGKPLSNYKPLSELIHLLENNIDTSLK